MMWQQQGRGALLAGKESSIAAKCCSEQSFERIAVRDASFERTLHNVFTGIAHVRLPRVVECSWAALQSQSETWRVALTQQLGKGERGEGSAACAQRKMIRLDAS